MLNAYDTTVVEDDKWDPKRTTDEYLRLLESSFDLDPAVKQMAESIKFKTGKTIQTVRGLLEHYYATVTIMCIPTTTQYNRIHKQSIWLYDTIQEKSEQSHESKVKVRMAPNAERLFRLISRALDRFADRNDQPFDFLEDSLREIPNSGTFDGNMLRFILLFRDTSNIRAVRHDVANLFNGVTEILASCIFLDMERNQIPGEPFPDTPARSKSIH